MKKSILCCLVTVFILFINVNAQNFWNPINGPYGGTINAVTMSSNGNIYAGGNGGLYCSTDNGDNWQFLNNGLNGVAVWAITFDISGNLLIGTDAGLYRSTDNGNNWSLISSAIGNIAIKAIAVNSSGQIFAGTSNYGLYKSTNNGSTWTNMSGGLSNTQIYSVAINTNGDVYVGTYTGLNRSTNNGVNWQHLNSNLNNDLIYAIVFDASGHIFTASRSNGIYRSEDNGVSWNQINSGIILPQSYSLAVASNGNIYAGAYGGIYSSLDNGDNWTLLNSKINFSNTIQQLAINSSGYIFAGTYIGGVYRSKDGGSNWDMANNGLNLTTVNSLLCSRNGQIFASIPNYAISNSSDNGVTWSNSNTLSNYYIASMAVDTNGVLFAGANGIYRSPDNGNTWAQMDNELSSTYVDAITIDSLGYIYAGIANGQVLLSTNNGFDWSRIDNGFTSGTIISIAVRPNGEIFVGAFDNYGIFYSPDRGKTWSKINIGVSYNYLHSLIVKPNNYVFVVTDAGISRSTNDGKTWTTVNNGFSNSANEKSIVQNSVGYLFVSATDGVYKSTNNGNSWKLVKSGLGKIDSPVLSIDVNGYIWAGTSGAGIYRSASSTIPPIPAAPLAEAPADSLSGSPLAVNLSWDSVAYAETYTVQAATDTSFTNLAVNDSLVTSTTRQVTGLSDGVKYYWRVAAKNASGTGSYSSVRSFSTIINTPGALSAQAFPSGKIIIKWADKSTNNIGYIVERKLSTDNSYTVIDTLRSDTVSFTDTTLTSINIYKYRVKAYNQIAVSSYSNEVTIKTLPPLPSLPVLTAPLSNLSDLSWTLNLSWINADNADSYRLQISKDSTFKTFFLNDSTITSTSRQVSGLEDGVRYYWRVSSINAAGVSPYSEIRSFSTLLNTPGTLTAQALPSEKIVLNWTDKSNNNIGYLIERKLVSDSSYTVIDTSKTDITVYTDTTLKSISTYTYRIKAYNKLDISLYSNEVTIKTIPSYPVSPILSDPIISTSNQPGTLDLSWSSSALADSYRLQVSIDSVFTTFFLNDSTITATTRQVTGLEDGIRYYWRVSSKNAAGVSPYSEVKSFSTILNTPGNLAATALWGYKVSLSWSDASKSVSGYLIERALAKDSIYIVIDTLKSNAVSYTDSSLTSVNTYVYRVKAYNALGSSAYSNVVTVSTITAVEDKYSQIPTKYEVLQNYPNPFNPTTIIKYGLPVQSHVKIVVYNILGAVVKELANTVQSAGYHNVNFGGNSISSGVYFYKIEAKALDGSKQFREIKKMMLLK